MHGAPDSGALALPPGSIATSPATCDSVARPTIRFFAQDTTGSPLSVLRVDVIFSAPDGRPDSLSFAVVPPLGAWQPTPPYAYVVNDLAPISAAERLVAFRFVPVGGDA